MSKRSDPLAIHQDLARLSCLVGALGSSNHSGWWNCCFLSPDGLETLTYNFPRTAVSAAVTATSKAAATKHDQAAGAVGVFHLFRLPPLLTTKVHQYLRKDISSLVDSLESRESCIEALREIARGRPPSGIGPGARDLGQFTTDDATLTSHLAASYLAAFTEDYETFPYFTLV